VQLESLWNAVESTIPEARQNTKTKGNTHLVTSAPNKKPKKTTKEALADAYGGPTKGSDTTLGRAKRSRKPQAVGPAAANLNQDAMVRYINLKAWRAEVAKEHNLPAYVIFHDATLAHIAEAAPQNLDDLQGISGIGVKKLEAYGLEVLQVCRVQLK
jgi:superfamily II DNA helicase RecQ